MVSKQLWRGVVIGHLAVKGVGGCRVAASMVCGPGVVVVARVVGIGWCRLVALVVGLLMGSLVVGR